MATQTKTLKPTAYTMKDLEERQARENFSHGYLGHSVRRAPCAADLDATVLRWLKRHGYDKDDAYQALNSTNARHMGDALEETAKASWTTAIAESMWINPESMYAAFNDTKQNLAEAAPTPRLKAVCGDAYMALNNAKAQAKTQETLDLANKAVDALGKLHLHMTCGGR